MSPRQPRDQKVTIPAFPPSRWRTAIGAGVIVGAGALAYANGLAGPFLLDDRLTVVENAQIRHLWPLSQALFAARETPTAGRPLVNLSFAMNYAAGGLQVHGYHLVNITIHVACALLLFGVVRRVLNGPAARSQWAGVADGVALASAALWLLHPLNTEAVNYLTQRTELMMGLFYIGTFYAMVRADDSPRPRLWRAASVCACALGMACKETMVTAPLMVWLYDWRIRGETVRETFRTRGLFYAALGSTWILLVALQWSGPRIHSAGWTAGVDVWTYLLNQTVMITRYLRLAVWPTGLVLAYGYPIPLAPTDVLPDAVIVLGLLAGTLVALRTAPRVGFLLAWTVMTLAPTSSIVPIATEVGAERRMYVPLMALAVLATVGIARLAQAIDRRSPQSTRRLGSTCAVVAVVAMAGAYGAETAARNREYRSGLVMAQTVLARWPTGYAHFLLATELISTGERAAALPHLQLAVRDVPRAEMTLGTELAKAGQRDDALAHLQTFVRLQPLMLEAVPARNLIGRLLMERGQFDAAADQFRLVLQMNPAFAEAHGYLADALFERKQFAQALPEYRQYLVSFPRDATATLRVGVAFERLGRSDDALAAFRRTLELDPHNGLAARDAAINRLTADDYAGVVAFGQQAAAINPDDPIAHDVLGLGLAYESRWADATAE
ncbi:MAG TPA: tetratricopeptide repeat protein, partial [Vicinamibacterales bacterium]|nr:tetratricopeptide repeat protein [Vicinamibacterales bacterium]